MSHTPRIIIDSDNAKHAVGDDVVVAGPDFHHLSHVLRSKVGDELEVLFRNSQIFHAVISQIDAQSLSVKLLREKTAHPAKNITLICGYPKPATAEIVVEKAVEIGISNIHFFFADRSQTRLHGEQLSKKSDRLEKIKIAALKQSGLVGQVTGLHWHESLKDVLNQVVRANNNSPLREAEQLKMVFISPDDDFAADSAGTGDSAGDNSAGLANAAEIIQSKPGITSYIIIIGPEGGLCAKEIELAKNCGFIGASLGNKTLRVETAVIASGMLLQLL